MLIAVFRARCDVFTLLLYFYKNPKTLYYCQKKQGKGANPDI